MLGKRFWRKLIMEYKIVTASSAGGLNNSVNALLKEGWKTKGSHNVVRTHEQKRFAGMQHKDTTYQHEYSQTMIK